MALNSTERAFMRTWLSNCIVRFSAQPPSDHRDQTIATLKKSLERYEDPSPAPRLRVIQGGLAA